MVSKSATTPGYALSVRYNQKNRLYFNACKAVGLVFVPLPIKSLGSWHPDAAQVISRLGSMVASSTGGDKDEVTRHLFQRLSVQLVRGNAALFLARTPTHPTADVDGDLDQDF